MFKQRSVISCSLTVVGAICGYVLLNAVVGQCSVVMLGLNNLVACVTMTLIFRRSIFFRDCGRLRVRRPEWKTAFKGTFACLLILTGLKSAQHDLGVFAAMQMIYDGFVITNSILDLLSERRREGRIKSLPFNMVLHIVMAAIVSVHIWVNWDWTWRVFLHALPYVCMGIAGYRMFNRSLTEIQDERRGLVTRLAMNIGVASLMFIAWSIIGGPALTPHAFVKVAAGATSILLVFVSLTKAYQLFGLVNLRHLVPVLVYDGLLITPAMLQMVMKSNYLLAANLSLTLAMVGIMILRSPKLQARITDFCKSLAIAA
jgi:hypothetical protein